MTRVWFVVPVHGRLDVTRVCLRQLARTCDAMADYGLDASAVVVGDDESLDVAEDLGFGTVRRDNAALGRKFNDGFQLACDPEFNPEPADYVVPCGSDDWIDPVVFRTLPPQDTIGIFRRLAVVDENRERLTRLHIHYKTAAGPKIIPRGLIAAAGCRPSEEDRKRAIDASTMEGIKRAVGYWPKMAELDVHDYQIVDWKSHGEQLNSYQAVGRYGRGPESCEPFEVLGEFYPSEAIEEMRDLAAVPA